MLGSPILPARLVPAEPGRSAQALVRCPWCEADHGHSASPGHRVAHCTREESPYRATGYEIQFPPEVVRASDPPDAPYLSRLCLWSSLEEAAPRLRSALLAPTLGARVKHHFDKRLGRARVSLFGYGWSIEPDAFPSNAEMRAPYRPGRPRRVGRDFITLLSELYGVPLGVVGLRLLVAVSGAHLDAEGKLAVAAAIEAAYARKADGRDGRA